MSGTDKLMLRFLRELNSDKVQEAFSSLDVLLDHLESKNDPEPFEIHLVDSAYQALEKIKMLESVMKQQVVQSNELKGSRLQRLYDKAPTSIGSSIFD
ncbi:MAG: hypothetical protein K9L62_10720 [Vallitaleaceae bacterium]|nr:hypothetical protein [Vallitaleaceae bacterium]